jgi:hypothetical protein
MLPDRPGDFPASNRGANRAESVHDHVIRHFPGCCYAHLHWIAAATLCQTGAMNRQRISVEEARQLIPGPHGERYAVPAGAAHRFEFFSSDLTVWVIFYS